MQFFFSLELSSQPSLTPLKIIKSGLAFSTNSGSIVFPPPLETGLSPKISSAIFFPPAIFIIIPHPDLLVAVGPNTSEYPDFS